MSARPRATLGRTDANHADVAGWYVDLYCRVHDTHGVGGGFGDIVVNIPTKRGPVMKCVEIKTADGELRPNQKRFAEDWGSSVVVVQTRDDVFAHVDSVQHAAKL